MKRVLITGAGTGFGQEAAMRLAEKGFDVIATVEIWAQVQTLKRQAAARGVTLKVEKLDVTNEGDREKALAWDVEILVNNAGVLEGGSVLDIPAANMRHQFEVNVIGPLLLTQGIAKHMVKRGKGRIVWVSSREGLNTNGNEGFRDWILGIDASTANRVARGSRSCKSPSCFAPISPVMKWMPVTLPPGRLKLATRPSLIGSLPMPKTTGMVVVAALAAIAAGVLPGVAMTAT